jgi:signal transduction histidine kinase/integral membrane sensor domain MASE1
MLGTRSAVWSFIGTPLLVGIGYFIGVQLGEALRFPPATTSVLWPPNSILTAALLLTPPKRWAACLAGALVPHFALQTSFGWPLELVGALFITNCSEALIAAGFIHAFSDAPRRFDTLRRVIVFLVGAGALAPLLSSFADAAVVHTYQSEAFWTVWRTRSFSNALTELSVVPLVVLVATHGRSFFDNPSTRRVLEALLIAILMIAALTFEVGLIELPLAGVPPTQAILLLPLFFWAALRFGAGGISAALFVTAFTASFAARMGFRPFISLAPAEGLLALQLSLILMSVPLFAVSALLDERRRAVTELGRRLRFKALLSELSHLVVRTQRERMVDTFDAFLARIGEFFGIDRAAILQLSPGAHEFHVFRQWTSIGIRSLPSSYSRSKFPWVAHRLLQGEQVVCASIDDLPTTAHDDRASFIELGLRSGLAIPIAAGNAVHGVLSLQMLGAARTWHEDVLEEIGMVSEVLANALIRARSDDALRSSEAMKTAILSSLLSVVAVIDRSGAIIAVNEKCLEAAPIGLGGGAALAVGTNYMDICRRAAAQGDCTAAEALAGIEQVLECRASSFRFEYCCESPVARWFDMSVTPLDRPEGGAVVSHIDVTQRKKAEHEAERARQDLAHVTRVSMMGELTAALAHQIRQPLTAILMNAQGAQRILGSPRPDYDEIRAVLSDIVDDDRRAYEVIQRMRDMMTKRTIERRLIEVSSMVRDVAKLMTSDTIIRNTSLTLDLAAQPLRVRGDHVQLQQAVLNLLMNAIEAVATLPAPERLIVVRTERSAAGDSAIIAVEDAGLGFGPGMEKTIFEPFFTTKSMGMGMGLAVARSMIESHNGRIWATNNLDRGATFRVSLPLWASASP